MEKRVILSHGKGGTHAIWYQQIPVLAQHYHVITWDQRGFGRSTNRLGKAGPIAAAEDIQTLLNHLQIAQAHLVGQSMGGWAVLGSTLRWPERTKSLVMANTIGGIHSPDITAARATYKARQAAKPFDPYLSMDGHAVIMADSAEKNMVRAFLYNQIGKAHGPIPADASDRLRDTTYNMAQVGALTTPTLFITGEHDATFPPSMIRQAAAFIPHAQVIEIPEADHSPYFETPKQWNEAVLSFWSSLG